MPLLLAAPARPLAVVVARLLDAVAVSSAQFLVIGLPLLLACGFALSLPWWAWGVYVFLLVLFLLLPALLTAALLLGAARLVGLRRVRAAVAVASAVLAVGMCLLLVSEFAGQMNRLGAPGIGRVEEMARLDLPLTPAYLPSSWASDSLIALGSSRPDAALLPLLVLLAATASCGVVCIGLGRRVLLQESLLEGEGAVRRDTGRSLLDLLVGLLPASAPVRALVAKDLRYVARDLVLLSQIGIPVILYLVPFVIAGQVGGAGVTPLDLWVLSVGMVGMIAYMETSIVSLSAVGLEGQAFWVVLHAPVSAGAFLRAKFAVAFSVSIALCAPLLLVSCAAFRAPLLLSLGAAAALLVSCAALCGLGVGMAGLFPRFVYDNPAHRASLAALVWGFVGAAAYVVLAGMALGGGAYAALQWPERASWLWAASVGVFALLSLLTGLIPMLLARARLHGYAWEH